MAAPDAVVFQCTMAEVLRQTEREAGPAAHARWVRISHWIVTASVLTLAFTGFVILMAHPRLYWGEVGNDLTPALIELPISRNYRHGGWDKPHAVLPECRRLRSAPAGPSTSSIRTAGGGACTSSPRGASSCPASCTCWPASSAVTSARTSGRGRRTRAASRLARRRRSPAAADSARDRRPAVRPAAEMRVLVRGLRRGAADRR